MKQPMITLSNCDDKLIGYGFEEGKQYPLDTFEYERNYNLFGRPHLRYRDKHIWGFRVKYPKGTHSDPVLRDFGIGEYHMDLFDEELFVDNKNNQANELSASTGISEALLAMRLVCLQPLDASGDKAQMSIFKNLNDGMRSKRVEVSIGKFYKQLLPEVSDEVIHTLVTEYKNKIFNETFTVRIGTDRQSFNKAYCINQCAKQIPFKPTNNCSELATSCMQGVECDGIMSSEAYASGDFQVVYLETQDGKVAARVIQSTINKSYSRIYASSIRAYEELKKAVGVDNTLDFDEHKLLVIKSERGYIGPYVDEYSSARKEYKDDDRGILFDCFVIDDDASDGWSLATTSPFIEESNGGVYCDWCDGEYYEDEVIYVESVSQSVCECCIDNYFSYSDWDDDYIENRYALAFSTQFTMSKSDAIAHGWDKSKDPEDYVPVISVIEEGGKDVNKIRFEKIEVAENDTTLMKKEQCYYERSSMVEFHEPKFLYDKASETVVVFRDLIDAKHTLLYYKGMKMLTVNVVNDVVEVKQNAA